MRKVIIHKLDDWSKIDERSGFWGKVDLYNPERNFGIHRYNGTLMTSGLVGVGRLYDSDNKPLRDDGKDHIALISSKYSLNPWMMLERVLTDPEYEDYMEELKKDERFLFKVLYDQPLIEMPDSQDTYSDILFALSYVNSCYALCKKGLKKNLSRKNENFTAKVRGKIDINKNIKQNTIKGRCDRFYCKYIEFSDDTPENRVLKAALIRCKNLLRQRFAQDKLAESRVLFCLNAMRHVMDQDVGKAELRIVTVGGLYSYYKPVLQQAIAILNQKFHNYNKDDNAGQLSQNYTVPYMIDMETLFEYYARTELKKVLEPHGYTLEKYSEKIFIQKGIKGVENAEKGIHLMPYCIPDIIIQKDGNPIFVIDAKYKPHDRSNRSDTHQLLSYVLLTGVDRCGFVMPGQNTSLKEMKTTGVDYLMLQHANLRYYELLLSDKCDDTVLMNMLA